MALVDPPIALEPLDEVHVQDHWNDFLKRLEGEEFAPLRKYLESAAPLCKTLAAIFELSPYLRTIAMRDTLFLQKMIIEGLDVACDSFMQGTFVGDLDCADETELKARLRRRKRECALLCGIADLGGWWPMEKVCRTLATFADAALGATCRFLLRNAHDRGKLALPDRDNPEAGSGLIILAMGKHGAFELNYSSDIDIICLFDGDAPAITDLDEAMTLFPRMARQLASIMQERTGDGYVFRTDLRLRPDPGSTPMALPVIAALNYYESAGQNWERAAHIKARLAAGDPVAGARYLKDLRPFIWRKYLDYAAIADIHSIKRQIHSHRGHGSIAVIGHNLKLGRGGIREIEFFVQTQQLIAGGRIDALRGQSTLAMLDELNREKWISEAARDDLKAAYRFLRNVEHRLQMVSDEQTHTMPTDEEGLLRIARMSGFVRFDAFSDILEMHLRNVEHHYAELFEEENALSSDMGNLVFTGDDDDPETLKTLSGLGFQRPSAIIRLVRSWHYGRYRAMQTAEARERLTELTPALLKALAETSSADDAAFAFDRFLQGLPRGVQLFALLRSNPKLLSLLAEVLGIAPRLADIITRKPHVFDSLLEPEFFQIMPTRAQLATRLAASLARSAFYEDGLDRARIFALEQKFLIGVRYLGDTIDAPRAALAYSELADVMIEAMLGYVQREFESRHGTVAGGQMAVVGMGRLGSMELSAGSDLDLILLYDHDRDAEYSNGEKPLAASQYFTRMTQRLITAMSALTAEGAIYELDFRLRPSGNAGPLATRIDSFVRYQQKEAWTWEHMALTRARLVAGDSELVKRAQSEIAAIVASPRNHEKLTRDVRDMRQRLEDEKPARSIWDIKTVKGGLLDIDFILQWAVLAGFVESGSDRSVTSAGKIKALQIPGEAVETLNNDKVTLLNALAMYSAIDQLLRLCLDGSFDPDEAPTGLKERLVAVCDVPDFSNLEAQLKETALAVRAVFDRLIDNHASAENG